MRHFRITTKVMAAMLMAALLVGWLPDAAMGQAAPPPQDQSGPPPQAFAPDQLDKMVQRIALYPDSLLAQITAAATFPDQIPDAAKWADEHHYLRGQDLANAITADQLPWDPSVQALLPFPSVLDMMASDMTWTTDLGNAFLAQRQDVMDAVQRERHTAYQYGYLRTNPQVTVAYGPYISIVPVDPAFIYVPYYDPAVVFFAPRPGFVIGAGIGWGFGIGIGAWFRPWGWGFTRFDWGAHAVIINNRPWGRVWGNRFAYVHPYPGVHRWAPGQRAPEGHALVPRSERERSAARYGHPRVEEHRRPH
jgi:hypothetical protein